MLEMIPEAHTKKDTEPGPRYWKSLQMNVWVTFNSHIVPSRTIVNINISLSLSALRPLAPGFLLLISITGGRWCRFPSVVIPARETLLRTWG